MMDFVAKMGLDTTAVTAGLSGVKGKVSQAGEQIKAVGSKQIGALTGQIGGLLGVTALLGGAKSIVDFGGKITDLADQFSLSTDMVQGLSYAAEQTGTSVETALGAIRKVGVAAVDAVGGNEDKLKAFERLGVTAEQLKTLSPDQIFMQLAASLKDMPMTAQTFADIQDTLGKSGQELIPMFNEGLAGMMQRAHEVGAIIDAETIAKLDEMGDTMGEAGTRLKAAFAPVITFIMDGINSMLRGFEMISEFMATRLTRAFDAWNKAKDGDIIGAGKAAAGFLNPATMGEDFSKTLDAAVKIDADAEAKAEARKGGNAARAAKLKGGIDLDAANEKAAKKKAVEQRDIDRDRRDREAEAGRIGKLQEEVWEKQVKAMPLDRQIGEWRKKLASLRAESAGWSAIGGLETEGGMEAEKNRLDGEAKLRDLEAQRSKGAIIPDESKLDSIQRIGGRLGENASIQNGQKQLKTLEDILKAMAEGNSNTAVLNPSK